MLVLAAVTGQSQFDREQTMVGNQRIYAAAARIKRGAIMTKDEQKSNWKIYYNKHDLNAEVIFYVEGPEKQGVEELFDKKIKNLGII